MKYPIQVAILFPFLLILLIQPSLSYRDYLLEMQFKANANYLAQKAAVEGYVTESMKQQIIDNLKRVGFQESEISITYQTVQVERGDRIDVAISAPRAPSFVFNFSGEDNGRYYARANIMSEFYS